jgi:RNA polymerase sigma-70 factor (sigma-E family)
MDREMEFREFVNARWTSLVATAYLVTADRGLAEDCVQEALARVHRRWRSLREEGEPVAYARRATLNAALSWRRRRRIAEVPLDVAADPAAPEDPVSAVDPQLVAALRSLPPRMRAVVVLRFLEDRSEAETARALGCSVGTVKSASSRGIARLRAALEPPGGAVGGRIRIGGQPATPGAEGSGT